jgi:hypothetical protein
MVTIVGQEHNTRGKQGATVLDWLTVPVFSAKAKWEHTFISPAMDNLALW